MISPYTTFDYSSATEYQHYSRDRAFDTVADELDVLLAHARTYRKIEEANPEGEIGRIAQILRIWVVGQFENDGG